MVWILVFIGMGVGAIIGAGVSFAFVIIERPIQWSGKSIEEWKELGVESPGERLPFISFISGLLSTTFSRLIIYLSGILVFLWRDETPSLIPMVLIGILLFGRDLKRVKQFQNNSGQPTEIGHLVGGIFGFLVFLWSKNFLVAYF